MNLPSVKTLESAFPGKGRILRRLLESSQAVREHPAAIARERQAYHPHPLYVLRLEALNAEAECFGVECVWRKGTGPGDCSGSPAFEYLNTGSMYALTIIRFANGRYRVADVGSIIERGNYE